MRSDRPSPAPGAALPDAPHAPAHDASVRVVVRAGDEAKDGLAAFLAKRKARWRVERGLRPGVYLVRLRAGGTSRSIRAVVVG